MSGRGVVGEPRQSSLLEIPSPLFFVLLREEVLVECEVEHSCG